tara:strand:+ start:659 stop:937 length:279 start_codon:yes stop_codon:yes gene_type:complete
MSNESENKNERIKFLEETILKVAKMLDMGLGLYDFAPDEETWNEMYENLLEPRDYLTGALGMTFSEWWQIMDAEPDHWVNKWYAETYGKASK